MDIRVVITGRWMDVYTWPLIFLDRLIVKIQRYRRQIEKKSKTARSGPGNGRMIFIVFFKAAEWILMVMWAFCYYFLLIVLRAINFFRSFFSA